MERKAQYSYNGEDAVYPIGENMVAVQLTIKF
jgi:hypothetical protein